MREKLLSLEDIQVDEAIKTCRATEIASQQLKELHKPDEMSVEVIKKYAHASKVQVMATNYWN